MNLENRMQVLKDSFKKLNDLKEYNRPIILKTIEEYDNTGIDELFINQQKLNLEKVNIRINELEEKVERLRNEIMKEL